jgi:hypothetical protein
VQIFEKIGVDLLRGGHTGKGEKKEAPYQGGCHPSYYAMAADGRRREAGPAAFCGAAVVDGRWKVDWADLCMIGHYCASGGDLGRGHFRTNKANKVFRISVYVVVFHGFGSGYRRDREEAAVRAW